MPDVGGDGAGFWFRGPNNRIGNNVAASAERFGFALTAPLPGPVRVPAFKGGDNSRAAESVDVDMTGGSVLEFANNEAYGTIQSGHSSEGWERSPLLACFHPSLERVFEERVRRHRTLEELRRSRTPGHGPTGPADVPPPAPTLEDVRSEYEPKPVRRNEEHGVEAGPS